MWGDLVGRCALESMPHDELLPDVLINGVSGASNQKSIAAANNLVEAGRNLAVCKAISRCRGERDTQLGGHLFGQLWETTTRKNS